MDKDKLRKAVDILQAPDIRDVLNISIIDDGKAVKNIVNLHVKPRYDSSLNALAEGLRVGKIFLENFYPYEIGLPDGAGEDEIYRKLDEKLSDYLEMAEEILGQGAQE